MFDKEVLQAAQAVQNMALSAWKSVWISANAGTGKTEVLTRRLIALLLNDMTLEPQHILALTFTNAGAEEMIIRLPERLEALARLNAAELAETLRKDLDFCATPETAARVKALAREVRQKPPFISTLHGLAQHMLTKFPTESGVLPGFALMDEPRRVGMMLDIQNALLVGVDGPLADALGLLLDELGETGWRDLTGLVVNRWRQVDEILRTGGLAEVLLRIQTEMGVRADVPLGPLMPDAGALAALRAICALEPAHAAAGVLAVEGRAREEAWRALLLTDTDTPRKRLLVKKLAEALPDVLALLETEAGAMAEVVRQRKLARQFDVTQALLVWAHAVRAAYHARKAEAGLLDFDDLLHGLERLLTGMGAPDMAAWVWYALDRRFKHMVIDEAQDNNAQQTRIVAHLARNLLSGDVGEGAPRTVLAVGDVKQCIFHFQGARPDLFLALRDDLKDWCGEAFAALTLTHNFRSGPAVLAAVDEVFRDPEVITTTTGDALTPTWPAHHAVAATRASRVEVWPVIAPAPKPELTPWMLAHERVAAMGEGEDIVCARAIAQWLKARHAEGVVMPSTGRALVWGDVMVLVQRNATAALMAGILRAEGVPVASSAGVEDYRVADAVALVRWVMNPADRLSLVQALKAYRNWTDAQVMALALAAGRVNRDAGVKGEADGEGVLWHTLVEGPDAAWLASHAALQHAAPVALVMRLAEATGQWDVLAPLLDEAAAAPTLLALVVRLEQRAAAGQPIEAAVGPTAAEGVRILTIHGSKGLQAPLVVMPETLRAMDDIRREKILWPTAEGDGVLVPATDADLSPLGVRLKAGMKQQARTNSLRGLYVALTRAVDWLVVAGYGKPEKTDNTWYGLVRAAADGEAWRSEGDVRVRGEAFATGGVRAVAAQAGDDDAPVVQAVAGWVAPEVVKKGESSPAQARGEQVHALLQGVAVPDAPADVVAEAEGVRAALPWLFAAGSRAEVAVGLLDGTVGRIDRLVPHGDALWVIDFKTGAVVEPIPPAYTAQVAGYMAAVKAQNPARTVRGAVVWTAPAVLVEMDTIG